ncbi:MAG: 1-(5-phosphoribosyl)-5-[(5-phosphoribosylamino)methylideneamino]imidazole-4-carboxamide isomerase [Nitrospirae bacterium]|nr:1-(5-phosphoribosyl)-5-[(5-phosphoribosylamino)methylideneamino]imidazole-4-carboxamide isomerase [Nitrospirota bacterium]
MMDLLPAVDILGGKCVRLTQGDYARSTLYGGEPAEMALRWEREGARWLHVVDLDGARTGRMSNLRKILDILRQVKLSVEVGGGIRTEAAARRLLDAGAKRVIAGTAALEKGSKFLRWAEKLGGHVWLSVDARGKEIMLKGWTHSSGVTTHELLGKARDWPIGGVVLTSILRDGALRGPDLRSARSAARTFGKSMILSGGISALEDLQAVSKLKASNVVGVIIGKALYEGRLTYADARRALS